jgi:hypothetical protein
MVARDGCLKSALLITVGRFVVMAWAGKREETHTWWRTMG